MARPRKSTIDTFVDQFADFTVAQQSAAESGFRIESRTIHIGPWEPAS